MEECDMARPFKTISHYLPEDWDKFRAPGPTFNPWAHIGNFPESDVPLDRLLGMPKNIDAVNSPTYAGMDFLQKQPSVRQRSNIAQLFDDLVNRRFDVHTRSLAENWNNGIFQYDDPLKAFTQHQSLREDVAKKARTAAPFLNYIDDIL